MTPPGTSSPRRSASCRRRSVSSRSRRPRRRGSSTTDEKSAKIVVPTSVDLGRDSNPKAAERKQAGLHVHGAKPFEQRTERDAYEYSGADRSNPRVCDDCLASGTLATDALWQRREVVLVGAEAGFQVQDMLIKKAEHSHRVRKN